MPTVVEKHHPGWLTELSSFMLAIAVHVFGNLSDELKKRKGPEWRSILPSR